MKKFFIVPLTLFASLFVIPTAIRGMSRSLQEAQKGRKEMRKLKLKPIPIQKQKDEYMEEQEQPKETEPQKLLKEKKIRQLELDDMEAQVVSLFKNARDALKEFQARTAVVDPQTWKDIGLFLDKAASLIALYATLQTGIEWTKIEATKKRRKHWHIGKKKRAKLNAEADKLDTKKLLLEKIKSQLEQRFPQLKEVILP